MSLNTDSQVLSFRGFETQLPCIFPRLSIFALFMISSPLDEHIHEYRTCNMNLFMNQFF